MTGARTAARAFCATFVLILTAIAAAATDAKLEMEGPRGLRGAVRSGSLVVAAAADKASGPLEIVAAARADYANILGILYREGRYGPTVSILVDGREASALSPFSVPNAVKRVVIRVDPGPEFTFGTTEIGPLARGTELPNAFRTGAVAGSDTIRDAAQAAVDGWRDLGHAKAQPGARRIVANHPARRLDATIAILPGQKLAFGRFTVAGNRMVRTERILEIAGFPKGRTFSPERLDGVARRLRKTGAFSSVSVEEAETPNPDGTLDIALTVVEEKPRRLGFGAEVSSSEGLALTAYWLHRNIFGGAERVRLDFETRGLLGNTSGPDYVLGGAFSRPGTWDAANTLNLEFEIAQLDEPDFFERRTRLEANLAREISARTEYSFGISWLYGQVTDDLGSRTYSLLALPATMRFDDRDKPLDPREGRYLRFEITPFTGTETGGRFYGDARYYRSLGQEQRLTLAGRLQVGSVIGASIAGTPPDMLFYSGGGGTVRGQPYRSLSVPLGGGDSIGGRNLIVASAEVRYRTTAKFALVGFADWGFVGADSLPGSGGASHAGAGLGLRYETPLGPIRLDVAAPISGSTGDGIQVYVGIGQAF